MTVFVYDKTFEGLLTAVFDAYSRRSFPDLLLAEGEPFPLFYDEAVTICTDDAKVDRVWKGLQKRLSAMALSVITVTWLSELPETDMLLFRYIRKAIDAPRTIELNFGDPDVLEVSKVWKKSACVSSSFFVSKKRRTGLSLPLSSQYIMYSLSLFRI